MQQLGDGTRQQGFSRTRTAHHDDVRLFNLHIIAAVFLQQTFVVIVHRNRQEALGIVLPDDILVEESLDFHRLGQFLQVQFAGTVLAFVLQSLLRYLVSLHGTAVADEAVHSRNQESHFIFRPPAKAASVLCSS